MALSFISFHFALSTPAQLLRVKRGKKNPGYLEIVLFHLQRRSFLTEAIPSFPDSDQYLEIIFPKQK